MKITALVVDDEPIARRAIVRLLDDDPDVKLLSECGDGGSAVKVIRSHSPDLVFLDIQMPVMTGLEVVAAVGAKQMPATVFVTAYEQFAVRAFEANAVDYLVKPFNRKRFLASLARVKTRLSSREADAAVMSERVAKLLEALRERESYLQRIPVRVDEHIGFIDVAEIVWIRASGNTVLIHLAHRVHELRESLSSLSARLDPRRFVRIHRSAVVNVDRVKTIHPWFNGYHVVTMDTGQRLRMSRYQHEAFLRLASARGDAGD